MQEDLLEASTKRYHPKPSREVVKFSSRPATAGSAGVLGVALTEVATVSTPGTPDRGKWDDKLTALRSQRRA